MLSLEEDQELYSWHHAIICAYDDLGIRLSRELDAYEAVEKLLTLVKDHAIRGGCISSLASITDSTEVCAR